MNSLRSAKTSIVRLTVTLENPPEISDASARVLKLVTEGLPHWYEGRAKNVEYMTDIELFQNLAISAAIVSARNGRSACAHEQTVITYSEALPLASSDAHPDAAYQ